MTYSTKHNLYFSTTNDSALSRGGGGGGGGGMIGKDECSPGGVS